MLARLVELVLVPSRPWYRWFPSDYLGDTAHLTIEEDCLYRRLLDLHWKLGHLPADEQMLARLARFPQDKFDAAWQQVRPFFKDPGGRTKKLVNARMQRLVADCHYKIEQKRDAAKARWNKKIHAPAMQTQSDPDPEARSRSRQEKDQETPPDPSLKTRSGGSDNCPRDPPLPPRGAPGVKSRKRGNGKDLEAEEKVEGLSLQAWQDYLTYRKERKTRPFTPTGAARQRRWLADQGDAAVQQAIVDATIRNGWQGLFALKSNGGKQGGPTRDQLLDAIGYTGPRETGTTIEGELADDDERR